MRLLYIVSKINNAGGVARVFSLKLNYLVENFGYELHVLTQNNGNYPLFYSFDERIVLHDMILQGSVLNFFNSFCKSLKAKIKNIKPDIIIVSDNGLKAYIIPFILSNNIPVIFECHGSKFVEENFSSKKNISKLRSSLKYKFKDFGANKFSKFVALSDESLKEWNVKNGLVIPNPSWLHIEKGSDLKSKKVISVARNSYEKGLDRLLVIWKKVAEKHPEWILEIYGESVIDLEIAVQNLDLETNVKLINPVKNIAEKYLSSSIYIMTSRSEGLPMVLIEAMASGLPCIAYNCPSGPRAIIEDGKNGFLIKDGDVNSFFEKLEQLLIDESLRTSMGESAFESSKKYNTEIIMQQWKSLFESLVNKN
jgi:glycosyltransferase involved in cell wall biosynthesis